VKKIFFIVCLSIFAGFLYSLEYELADSIEIEEIIVWPVMLKSGSAAGGFITLDEGIASGHVVVSELGSFEDEAETFEANVIAEDLQETREPAQQQSDSAPLQRQEIQQDQMVQQTYSGSGMSRVNTLHISNSSGKPLFLMAGEIIRGGKQNRVVMNDMIIPPSEEPLPLDVFCIEEGRWSPHGSNDNDMTFTSGKELVTQGSLRKTIIVEAEQSQVWSKVSEINEKQSTDTETSDYTENLENAEYMQAIERHLAALLEKIPELNVAGIVVGNSKGIFGADVMAFPEMFGRLKEKILRIYLMDILMGEFSSGTDGAHIDREEADAFLSEMTTLASDNPVKSTDLFSWYSATSGHITGSYLVAHTETGDVRLHQVFFRIDDE
jgi:hypothetical protein